MKAPRTEERALISYAPTPAGARWKWVDVPLVPHDPPSDVSARAREMRARVEAITLADTNTSVADTYKIGDGWTLSLCISDVIPGVVLAHVHPDTHTIERWMPWAFRGDQHVVRRAGFFASVNSFN